MPCQEREGSKSVRRASQQAAASLGSLEDALSGARLLLLQSGTCVAQALSAA